MTIRIEPYKTWSGGARQLGLRAGILRVTDNQVKLHGDFDIIINWGRSERRFNGQYINKPEKVKVASNKILSCKLFKRNKISTPPFTEEPEQCQKWLKNGSDVLARVLTRASGGRGIKYLHAGNNPNIPKAAFYTRYIKKTDEYRVHVWQGEVIDVQQKRRNKSTPDEKVNWQIRNHNNGFIYSRSDVVPPECIIYTAIAAVSALALDFGAVDLGFNVEGTSCVVYEVNTAPGLEGTTLEKYYKALVRTLPQIKTGSYKKRRALRGEL